ncbi:MAG: hypothetical protein AAF629_05670 [Chloroflexota bacterium]
MSLLKILLSDVHIKSKVLFGSDFYLVEKETFRDRELSITIRSQIGETLFTQIAQ